MTEITDTDKKQIAKALDAEATFAQLNARRPPRERIIDHETCQSFREQALDGKSARQIARDKEFGYDPVRKHIKGKCPHSDGEIHRLEYKGTYKGEWVECRD